MGNLKRSILFMLVLVGLPILVNIIANALASVITIDFIMNLAYISLGILTVYFMKEGF